MTLSLEHAKEICKIGQGHDCCRYLVMGAGFQCAKLTAMRLTLDARAASMNARGDNCEGLPWEEASDE